VKRLWIAPEARGQGLARRLMQRVEAAARGAGLTRLVLDTNATLTEAMALYRRLGWQEIARYNDNPYAQAWFAKDLAR
jgi:ribosomal protein S18 acetylase RimI-like enzyme